MIPQRTSQQPSAEQAQKQREYLKQQQKLRLMASSTTQKTVTADTLINNLLEKKDTFKPADSIPSNLPSTSRERALDGSKPPVNGNQQVSVDWLSPTSPNFPALYRRVWTIVGQSDGLVDTGKVFPLLLTSGLPTDVLGYIWGLVNRTVAGKLTEQELYSLLALVALAQRGYSFNSANVLSLVSQPPLPNLNLGPEPQAAGKMRREELNLQNYAPAMPMTQPTAPQHLMASPLQPTLSQHPMVPHLQPQLQPVNSITTSVFHSDAISSDLDDFDDFAEFQSATLVTPNSSHSSDLNMPVKISGLPQQQVLRSQDLPVRSPPPIVASIPSFDVEPTPEPMFVQKFPSVAVVGGGRSIGSRLANHSLGAPKINKPKHHKHHHHHHHRNVPPMPLAIADDDFSDFQQASSEEVFSKCSIKPPPTHTYLLKETAIRSETPINVDNILNNPSNATISTEIFSDITTEEVKSPAKEATKKEKGSELMGVDEDRYGALRALSFANEESAEPGTFEDFFSTASTATADDSFADISERSNPPSQGLDLINDVPWSTTVPNKSETAEFTVDDWGNFESVTIPTSDFTQLTELNSATSQSKDNWGKNNLLMDEVPSYVADTNLGFNTLETSLQSSSALTTEISENKNRISQIPPFTQISTDLNAASNIISNSSQNEEDDFGDFVGPDAWLEEKKQCDESLSTEEVKEADAQSVGNLWLDYTKTIDDQLWLDGDGTKTPKETVLENHLVSNLWLEESKGLDTQSVSSLELPGLDQAWDTIGEWKKCLQSCVPVFQYAVDTFNAITEPDVLQEVLVSSQGQDYLRDLVEVWSVCQRIASSYRQLGTDHKLDSLLLTMESSWDSLKVHYSRAQVPAQSTSLLEGPEICCICLVAGAKLEFEEHTYHAPCANVWLHYIDTVLPVLQSS